MDKNRVLSCRQFILRNLILSLVGSMNLKTSIKGFIGQFLPLRVYWSLLSHSKKTKLKGLTTLNLGDILKGVLTKDVFDLFILLRIGSVRREGSEKLFFFGLGVIVFICSVGELRISSSLAVNLMSFVSSVVKF